MKPQDPRQLQEFREDMAFVLRNSQSRRILWRILQQCGIYRTSYDGSRVSEVAEGMRSVGLAVIDGIGAAGPLSYANFLLQMQQAELMKREGTDNEDDAS